jgi:hypothetical protein
LPVRPAGGWRSSQPARTVNSMDNQEQETQTFQQTPPEPSKSNWLHSKLLGYGFLVVIFIVAVIGIYQWQYGGQDSYIDSFDECVENIYGDESGNLKNELDLCNTEEGRTFPNPRFILQDDNDPDPTADWQTYRNEVYGFEFRYPNNLGISVEREVEELNYLSLILSDQIDRQRLVFSLGVNEPGRDFQNTTLVLRTSITIDYVQATKTILEVTEGHEQGNRSIVYQYSKNNNSYLVYVTGGNDPGEIPDQILSTFRFIN